MLSRRFLPLIFSQYILKDALTETGVNEMNAFSVRLISKLKCIRISCYRWKRYILNKGEMKFHANPFP